MLMGRLERGDCFLSMTDSSTSEGWSKLSHFSELGEEPIQAEVRIEVCREDAKRKLEFGVKDYSQWFPGEHNVVSDALSRDDDRSDQELTNIFKLFCSSQIPSHFKIVPLPAEIVSFLTSVLLKLPEKMQLQEKHTRTKLGRGPDGKNIASQSELVKTSSLTPFLGMTESDSWEPLPWLCAKEGFLSNIMAPWLRAQSEVPFQMYLRPSGRMEELTPPGMRMGNLEEFYRDSFVPSEIKTPIPSSRRPCPHRC